MAAGIYAAAESNPDTIVVVTDGWTPWPATCGCRKLCRSWSGGIPGLVGESVTASRFHDLEVTVWLVWRVGGDGWSLVE